MTDSFPGRLLAIDHGLKYLGFATCDAIGLIATPHSVLERRSKAEDFTYINQLIEQKSLVGIVLGLPPVPPDFEGFSQADKVKNWSRHLLEVVKVPVYFWDEGLSSMDAEDILLAADKNLPERVDAHAAAVILQSLLDALREGKLFPEPVT